MFLLFLVYIERMIGEVGYSFIRMITVYALTIYAYKPDFFSFLRLPFPRRVKSTFSLVTYSGIWKKENETIVDIDTNNEIKHA
jgi:hypothetical protein